MACRTGCPTQDHASWAECARGVRIGFVGGAVGDYTAERQLQRNIDAYKSARAQGIQPDGTSMRQIETAVALSDKLGKPYGAAS